MNWQLLHQEMENFDYNMVDDDDDRIPQQLQSLRVM
jgi:hypothetical protein